MTNPHTFDPSTHKVVPVNSIVLNPAAGVVWEFLNGHKDATLVNRPAFLLAQEIRKQLPTPRMGEPTALGAVVRASDVGEVGGRIRTWTRFRHHQSGFCWIDSHERVRCWDDLEDPEAAS